MSAKLSEKAAELQSAAASREKCETFPDHSTKEQSFSKDHSIRKKIDDDLMQDSRVEGKITLSNAENNALLIKPAKGASLKTITFELKSRFGAHYWLLKKAWSIPFSAKKSLEEWLHSLKIVCSLSPISDEYFRKTKMGQEAADKWIRIDILERQYNDELGQILVVEDALEKEIFNRNLNENEEIVIEKRNAIEKRKEAQKILQDEINQRRISVGLLEKYDEENPLNAFLIEPGKIHLVADKGTEILSDPKCGIFQQQGMVVRVLGFQTAPKKKKESIKRPDGALTINMCDEIALINILNRRHNWMKFDARSKENKSTDFPDKAAKMILSMKGKDLPFLKGFVCCPTLREDGSLLETPGYDEESGLFFDPCGTIFPKIPENPTQAQAKEALNVLHDLIKDFPFADDISRSVALSELMTAVIRRSLDLSPGFANDASTRSSGKTLLAKLSSYITTGKEPTILTPVPNEEEMGKRLGAAFMAGDPVILIDNIDFDFASRDLCVILTASTYNPRILGQSKSPTVGTNSQVIFTGNNLVFRGDICTRILKCRLLPDCEHPEERKFERNLEEYTPKTRDKLVTAILTIIRAYIAAGFPGLNNLPSFRTYSNWTRFVRAPLVWLGEKDPYESAKEVKENDPEKEEISALFPCLFAAMKLLPIELFTVKHLIKIVSDPQWRERKEDENKDIQTLYDILLEVASNGKGGIDGRTLGNKIQKFQDCIIDGYRLTKAGKFGHTIKWKISKIH